MKIFAPILLFFMILQLSIELNAKEHVWTTDKLLINQDTVNSHGFYIPKDVDECVREIDRSLTKKSKQRIRRLNVNEINRIENIRVIGEWGLDDSTRTALIFYKLGLYDTCEMESILIECYYNYLQNRPFDFEGIVLKKVKEIDSINIDNRTQYLKRQEMEYIDGIYIPKDLNDSFVTLDTILNKVDIEAIKQAGDSAIGEYHFGLGRWMRNYWGLWGGSRLEKYLRSLGINHADDMSGIILVSYTRYLRKEDIKLDEQIKHMEKWYAEAEPPLELKLDEEYYSDEYKKFLKTKKQELIIEKDGYLRQCYH